MSRGLAPTRPSYRLSRAGSAPIRIPEAANDNEAPGRPAQSEAEIRAALGHFARHQLRVLGQYLPRAGPAAGRHPVQSMGPARLTISSTMRWVRCV